eukprot:GHRQ01029473.1.p1 GENE.GHRQ01029473.1~~GHRQ01029473.1.p1  ORF type:complete len:230 (+),score=20.58 GHRQ01029473.1:304-993(+)
MPPGRKAKGKQSEGLDANEARLALQLLDRNEQLSEETLLKVFRLGQTPCPPACGIKPSKGSKDNPECFHGLMPAEGSFRKKGLWQKEPVLGQLGHDPADDKRPVSCTEHCSTSAAPSMQQRLCHCAVAQHAPLLLYIHFRLRCSSQSIGFPVSFAASAGTQLRPYSALPPSSPSHVLCPHTPCRGQAHLLACATWATPATSTQPCSSCKRSLSSGARCTCWSRSWQSRT